MKKHVFSHHPGHGDASKTAAANSPVPKGTTPPTNAYGLKAAPGDLGSKHSYVVRG